MRSFRCIAAAAVAAMAWLASAPRLSAQQTGSVAIFGPPEDTLRSVTPTFTVQIANFPVERPLQLTLQLSPDSRFLAAPTFERTIQISDTGTTFTIAPDRPLPEGTRLYFRAVVIAPSGVVGISLAAGPKVVPAYVTPLSPPVVPGQPVRTRTPKFVWHSPQIGEPPGPWRFEVRITNETRGTTDAATVIGDTTYTPGRDLEPNSRYTWSITARVTTGIEQSRVPSPFSFVIEDSSVAIAATELYAPFPNPFPTLIKDATCVWFDLREDSRVNLDVYDLRGIHVRRLLPNGDLPGIVPKGRYGRGLVETSEGCDRRFAWDGTDDGGRSVPEGVYLIRFRADGIVRTKKVLFRGRH